MPKVSAACFCICLWLFTTSCHTDLARQKEKSEVKGEHESEDGMEEYMQQRFKMTVDPALNYVPSERLTFAKEEANRRSNIFSQRTTGNLIWEERGPNNVGGRTRTVLVDKSDATGNTIFAGSVGGGIWKCTNFKSAAYSWTKMNDQMENLAVSCIAQHPTSNNVMYAGTGEGYYNADAIRGGGIFKSIDGGTTWNVLPATIPNISIGNYDFFYVQHLLVTNNGDVYATARGYYCTSGGVFKSTDGGTSWTRVIGSGSSCSTASYYRGNDILMSANGDLYSTTGLQGSATGTYGHVFKSSASLGAAQGNAGQWTEITPTPPTGDLGFRRVELACAPSSSSTLYLLCQKYNGSNVVKFYKSVNSGASWTAITPPTWCTGSTTSSDFTRGQAWYDLAVAYDPANASNIFIGGVDVMKSTNGGTSFTQATQWSGGCGNIPVVHADIHSFTFINGSSSDLIVSCDGGIFYSADGGVSFTRKNTNYNVTQYYAAAISPLASSNYMLAGAQDNGSHKFSSAGINSITTASGGDGANCFIDQADPTYQITSYVYANYYISRNGGSSFNYYINDGNGDFVNPGEYDSQSKILYCGYGAGTFGVVTNIVSGTPQISSVSLSAMNGQYVSALKVDPNTANRLYMALYSGTPGILKIDNANAVTPTASTLSFPASSGYISCIDVEKGNANHLLATLSNFGVVSVYESTNGGLSWSNIEGDLPDMPVNWGIFLPNADKRIALATEVGVWTTSSAIGSFHNWLPDNNGMANVNTQMLKFRESDSTIVAATHGRGLFTTSLGTLLPLKLVSFTGHLQENHAVLNWKTSSEINTSRFEVEKSFDGQYFTKAGTVKAAGNSSGERQYAFTDLDPAVRENYYRLKMIDVDGKNSYSNIVLLKSNEASLNPTVLSNPFTNYIDIRFAKLPIGEVRFQLTNMSGSVVDARQVTGIAQNVFRYNIQTKGSLAKGVYVLGIAAGKEKYSIQVLKK